MIIYLAAYLAYDGISSQEKEIEKGIPISSTQLGILYSVYNFPNTVMVLLGGILFDSLGVRKSKHLILLFQFFF